MKYNLTVTDKSDPCGKVNSLEVSNLRHRICKQLIKRNELLLKKATLLPDNNFQSYKIDNKATVLNRAVIYLFILYYYYIYYIIF